MNKMTAAPVVLTRQISQSLEHVESLCNFAYEQGFRELGYDPVEVLRAAIASRAVVCKVARATLTDEQIIEIRDEHLPSQGERFDCIAYARAILDAATPAQMEDTARLDAMILSGCHVVHRYGTENYWLMDSLGPAQPREYRTARDAIDAMIKE